MDREREVDVKGGKREGRTGGRGRGGREGLTGG